MKRIPFSSHAEWLALRTQYIGGSEIGAIVGCHPYKTSLQVKLSKKNQFIEDVGEAAEIGKKMEPVIRRMYIEKTGRKVIVPKAVFVDGVRLATLDGIVREHPDGVWECKHPGWRQLRRWENDQTPEEIMCQIQWYMGITGLPWCDLTALLGGDKWILRRIDFDPELYGLLSQAADKWWRDYIIGDKNPPAEGGDLEVLARLNRPVTEQPAELEPYIIDIETYQSLAAEIKKLEKERDDLEARIKQQMLDTQSGQTSQHWITWKEVVQRRFSTQEFRADYPELYEKYSKDSVYKRFTIRRKEDE